MKIKCLIVEDEPIAQQILEKYILQIDSLDLVGKCKNAFEALNVLHREKIDVLFLDIKMPSLSGLDMLKTLQNPPKVILTTAFSEFALESYEYGIIDYLLKPIAFERFLKAVNKVLVPKNFESTREDDSENPKSDPDFIFFKADKKIHKFYFSDILFFEGNGNYVNIHSEKSKPLMVLGKLGDLENKLSKNQFIRVHKSYVINVSKIQEVEGNMIKFKDNLVPVSSSYKQNFDAIFRNNS